MSVAIDRLKSELGTLTQAERAELAHFLLQTLDPDEDADAEAAWDAELARRATEIRSNRAEGKPAAQVFAELRERYS